MKSKKVSYKSVDANIHQSELQQPENSIRSVITSKLNKRQPYQDNTSNPDEILLITSYPPRECGIATYSQDLIKSLNQKFSAAFVVKVCALESGDASLSYPDEVKLILRTSYAEEYGKMAEIVNKDKLIKIVVIQHEFGLFFSQEQAFLEFLFQLSKPVIIVFHTVLPHPDHLLKSKIKSIATVCRSVIVMTHSSADILRNEYELPRQKITVIAHGTHLVHHLSEEILKQKYGLKGKKVLTTFGLLSSGKGIETTIDALPAIAITHPEVVFLVIGKTHPEVVKTDGEKYREMLVEKVRDLNLQNHVRFINKYLDLPELLEYLQLTDIYLFTATNPNQAVSGTFAYAMSCACPIISTPIPHALEMLTSDTGIIIDFHDSNHLAKAVIQILSDDQLRHNLSQKALQKIVSTAWENSAVAHAKLFGKIAGRKITLQYTFPVINLDHLKHLTTDTGIIQFSKINQPDLSTGYTLDDNARALIAACMYFQSTGDRKIIFYIQRYLNFIKRCQQPSGHFLNYLNENLEFTDQNSLVNLDDANGRAIWALGYVISLSGILPVQIISDARKILEKYRPLLEAMHSTRAMAFVVKGLYYAQSTMKSPENLIVIKTLAYRLVQMYKHEATKEWEWFEESLTYANSILPEAMLYAWILTGKTIYLEIAKTSLKFLISKTFNGNGIEVISNKHWLKKGQEAGKYGEQPIDVAYTIMTLSKFYEVFQDENYRLKMVKAFNWFLGDNRLHQIVYNPCTGGCYDGLEESNVNINQGAESTVSYLMARLTIDNYQNYVEPQKTARQNRISFRAKQTTNQLTN